MTRKGVRGILGCVVHEDVTSRKKQLEVRGTTNAAILKGNPKYPGLIASIVYDTKPVH